MTRQQAKNIVPWVAMAITIAIAMVGCIYAFGGQSNQIQTNTKAIEMLYIKIDRIDSKVDALKDILLNHN